MQHKWNVVPKSSQITSPYTRQALQLLGQLIREGRVARQMTALELAERAGIHRSLLHRIERGDPRCTVGAVFEVATIVGVSLFEPDPSRLNARLLQQTERLTLLPQRVRHETPEQVPDAF